MRSYRDKIKNRTQLGQALADLREQGRRVVFTNGCFDLLHPGHARYLAAARGHGDVLVVGLNSDESIRRLKGPGRPILKQNDRAEVMAALEAVDLVTIFNEDTPQELIEEVRPNVLVKGGDWSLDQIVGRDLVEASGGSVISINFETGYSSSEIINRIRRVGQEKG